MVTTDDQRPDHRTMIHDAALTISTWRGRNHSKIRNRKGGRCVPVMMRCFRPKSYPEQFSHMPRYHLRTNLISPAVSEHSNHVEQMLTNKCITQFSQSIIPVFSSHFIFSEHYRSCLESPYKQLASNRHGRHNTP
jgi:hypothetical protein